MIALKRLIKLANRSNRKHQHAALIFKGNSILGIGNNDETTHAEIHALFNARWDGNKYDNNRVKGAKIISIRSKNGILKIAYPCEFCLKTIHRAGIRWVIYSDEDGLLRKVKVSECQISITGR